jgi:hypothetical protein
MSPKVTQLINIHAKDILALQVYKNRYLPIIFGKINLA